MTQFYSWQNEALERLHSLFEPGKENEVRTQAEEVARLNCFGVTLEKVLSGLELSKQVSQLAAGQASQQHQLRDTRSKVK